MARTVRSLSKPQTSNCHLLILISGSGTNLQVIIDQCANGTIPAQVCGVISDEPQAKGIQRAKNAGIQAPVVDHHCFDDRQSFDHRLDEKIDCYRPDLVVLAGFMRILDAKLVERYYGRMLNIHPSLLPDYPGLNTHARAIADLVTEHGASVHFVTPELDAGPIVIQGRVPVLSSDTPESLAQRVHQEEYRIYPIAITWFAKGRLSIEADRVLLDDRPVDIYV
mgnify:FL=1